jgi:eukaryotic-like serine/threonine-protein kinase
VDVATGGIRTIGKVPTVVFWGGAWNRDGIILLGGPRLQRMSADGDLTDIYPPDAEIVSQSLPSFLPDGRTFFYAQESSNTQRRGVFLGSLDSPAVTRVLPEPANAVFSSRGYLLYGRQGTLFAQHFDMDHRRLSGEPLIIGSDVEFFQAMAITSFSVADDMLVWSGAIAPPARLTWIDREGKTLSTTPELRQYYALDLAPNERQVVTVEVDSRLGPRLFLIDLTRASHSRLTTGDQSEQDPVWSPDSREVALASGGLFTRRIDQDGRTTLLADALVGGVEDWTHDGRFVVFLRGNNSIWALPMEGDRKPIPVLESSSMVDEPHVSRDGGWLAYSGHDSGQWEVYVQPFLRPGSRVRVSTKGGSQPRWRGDGKELFYLALDGAMMSVRTSDPTSPGAPRQLFKVRLEFNAVDDQYDVTADGQRFLVVTPEGQQATRLTVLSNWPSVLKPR